MRYILFLLGFLILSLAACKSNAESSESQESETGVQEEAPSTLNLTGNYVSVDYDKRNEGYDWISVAVTNEENNNLKILVRSRADKKKPTCTFDATLTKVNENTYQSMEDDKTILYIFENGTLTIKPELPEYDGILAFYCSGGATVADTYQKIDGDLDTAQIDKTSFNKILMLQGIGFNISAIENNSKNTLTMSPFGLSVSNDPVTIEINGEVMDAEIEDLNSDGSPDVLVYTQTKDANAFGYVYGFTTNSKKSMSFIYFPPVLENKELKPGYEGHDKFAIVETSLVQRFPIYKNGKPTGKTRQISYKLKDGEATRGFAVDQVSEY